MDRIKMMETFVRIAKAGSMTKAADELGLSRAIVSMHLQQLEVHLGARLFNRTTRHVSLTEIGSEYLDFCGRLLSDLEEEERFVSELQTQPRGTLKISSPINFGNMQLAPILADFLMAFPDITVTLHLSDAKMSPSSLIDSGFDIAVHLGAFDGPLEDTSIITKRIGQFSYIACASPAYLEQFGSPEIPEDLVNHSCLIHSRRVPEGTWRFVQADGNATEVKVSGTLRTNSIGVLRVAAKRGAGIALLSDYSVTEDLVSGELVRVLPGHTVPDAQIHLLFAHRHYLPRKIRAFLDFLDKHFEVVEPH